MPLPQDCASFFDCDNNIASLEQIFKRYLIIDDGNGCPVLKTKDFSQASREVEFVSTIEVDATNSPVVAGAKSVTFNTSDDFSGTINGVSRGPNLSIPFPAGNYDTTPAIPFTIVTGEILIDKVI